MRRPRLRRAILILSAALVAGLLITVGTAWAFASFPPRPKVEVRGHALRDRSGRMFSAVEEYEHGRAWWIVQPGEPLPGVGVLAAPRWVGLPETPNYLATYLYGWPAPCLARYGYLPAALDPARFPSVSLPPPYATWDSWDVMVNSRVYTFPLRPVWTALLLDTLIYGASLLGMVALLHLTRRAVRIRLGGCARCGYDRRGLAADAKCPECGTVPAS